MAKNIVEKNKKFFFHNKKEILKDAIILATLDWHVNPAKIRTESSHQHLLFENFVYIVITSKSEKGFLIGTYFLHEWNVANYTLQ